MNITIKLRKMVILFKCLNLVVISKLFKKYLYILIEIFLYQYIYCSTNMKKILDFISKFNILSLYKNSITI